MSLFSRLTGRRRTLASTAVVGVAAVAVTTLAVVHDGNPTAEVDLHDGGVWVTNASLLAAGHFNDPSRQLDGSVRVTSPKFDVRQQGDDVLMLDQQTSTVAAVDVASMSMSSPAEVTAGSVVEMGGAATAILEPDSGDLFVMPTASVSGFARADAEPTVELGKNADITVGHDGTVHAVSPRKGAVVTIPVDVNGDPQEPEQRALAGLGKDANADITVVGQTPVVLDASSGQLFTPDGVRAELSKADASSARLQQASADGESVFLETADSLVEYPLAGGDPVATPSGAGDGAPSQPVWLNGCAYAAWGGTNQFVRDCAGTGDDESTALPGAGDTEDLRFRVNRDVIVLNDVASGGAWQVVEEVRKVDNWDDLTPPEGEESEEEDDSTDETIEVKPPERSEDNQQPIANDDRFGVRAGRSTLLKVLDNDSDPDGDILTVETKGGGPKIGEISKVEDGSSFQIAVQPGVTGSGSFTYEVDDGRGGTDRATVRVDIHPEGQNEPPEPKREPVVPIEVGGTVTYNVLQDWRDADGDDVFLTAVEPLPGDGVDFTPDGQVTYRATSGTQGPHDIPITVSDGDASAPGVLKLDIRPVGSSEPIANNDHVVVRAGETATVAPLANDVNPTSETLRLTNVGEAAGAAIEPDYANKTFSFRSEELGTEYVEYMTAAGPNSAIGYVRVDVIPNETVNLPPVAVRDVALLPAGGEALVNVLGNDEDPTGGVLVLQSVSVPPEAKGISVAVLNHEAVRVTDTGTLEEPITIGYRVSNGPYSSEGEAVIIPIPAETNIQPPVANDDEITVRVGDVATVDVLDNDFHPNDDEMHLVPELVEPLPEPEQGEAFVSQDSVRFKAGNEPGTAYITYEVEDTRQQRDSAFITVNILELDEERNQAPNPEDLEAHALAGTETQIAVPLNGLDPDGDSVELLGIDSAPRKGAIRATEKDHFVYEAFPGSTGVDTFSYRVRDRLGAEATATIRVGIAPTADENQAPYAETDSLFVRPGREVAVPVLANDSDPDGDQIGLVGDGVILPEDVPGLEAEAFGDRLDVLAPAEEMETSLQYTIEDAKGARSTGLLMVTVDEDVPLQRPIARDDAVLVEDVTDDLTAEVALLENDEDPDGTVDALDIEVERGELLADGVVRVPVTEERQLIRYTVTDEDGQAASAFVHVPAVDDLAPRLVDTAGVEVASGERIEIPLSEHVTVQGGGGVRITQADRVSAVHGNGDELVVDAGTLAYTSAEGYHGPDAITFEATDGTGPDDPEGRTSTLSIPITVLPPGNVSPEFTDGSLEIGAGDGPQTIDLAALTEDPDPDDMAAMSYAITGGENAAIDARVDGQTIVAEAGPDAQGEQAALSLTVDDGESEPVTGTVRIGVTATNRAMPAANDDAVDDAHQGETYDIPVLENDFNPFPDEDLTVVDARVDAGTGSATFDDGSVSVTPGADFHGTMTVMYRIQDATGDSERQAQGRIELTVKGRPDAPTEVTGSEEMNRSAIISWRPPANNGEPIESYTVSSVQGPAVSQECAATTCTITGLTNGADYRFQVTATNAVGESEASLPSPVVTPDVKPERPAAPRITGFGDGTLDVTWAAPVNEGTPIENYTVYISPAAPDGSTQKQFPAGTLGTTWSGLTNGKNYTFSVSAKNGAREPSDTSRESNADYPAAPPAAPGAPTVAGAKPVGSESQMTVNWAEVTGGGTNGDPVKNYQVIRQGGAGSGSPVTVSAPATSATMTVPISSEDYTYKVRAENKAGWGAWSAASNPQRAAAPPGAPTNARAVETGTTGAGGAARITWSAPTDLNGAKPGEVSYLVSWSGGSRNVAGTSLDVGGLSNGSSYKFTVRTVTQGSTFSYQSDSVATSNAVVPYGKPHAPVSGVSASGGKNLTFTASRSGSGNGRAVTDMEIYWNTGQNGGGGTRATSTSTNWSKEVSFSYDHTGCTKARVQDETGTWSDWSAVTCATTPKPRVWITKGTKVYEPGQCTSSSCAKLVVNTENFEGGTYQVQCKASGNHGGSWGYVSRSLPANGQKELSCYFGDPGEQVWVSIQGYGDSERLTWY